MGCEFEGMETHTGKDKIRHVRKICTGNLEGCLVDDPMGWLQCTRRTWLLMQNYDPVVKPVKIIRPRFKVPKEQSRLI